MIYILVILAAVFLTVLGLYGYKRLKLLRVHRMGENEYNAAVALWNFARAFKAQVDDAMRQGSGVLDFRKVMVPHSHGYKIELEIAGGLFRVYAVPSAYARTGRLSFYIDNSLTLRASDHTGKRADEEDPEYAGAPSAN